MDLALCWMGKLLFWFVVGGLVALLSGVAWLVRRLPFYAAGAITVAVIAWWPVVVWGSRAVEVLELLPGAAMMPLLFVCLLRWRCQRYSRSFFGMVLRSLTASLPAAGLYYINKMHMLYYCNGKWSIIMADMVELFFLNCLPYALLLPLLARLIGTQTPTKVVVWVILSVLLPAVTCCLFGMELSALPTLLRHLAAVPVILLMCDRPGKRVGSKKAAAGDDGSGA